ncbi:MAG: DUF6485 family protein [Candidatus Cloacimonetes bacterium]|nr:DUF6485 family protein [Candidatus Cloacimonadota bacterium]
MRCNNQSRNKENCNCTYSCSKKGICCECISYHRSMNELPACYFPNEAEKTYNRSIEYFIDLYQQGRI